MMVFLHFGYDRKGSECSSPLHPQSIPEAFQRDFTIAPTRPISYGGSLRRPLGLTRLHRGCCQGVVSHKVAASPHLPKAEQGCYSLIRRLLIRTLLPSMRIRTYRYHSYTLRHYQGQGPENRHVVAPRLATPGGFPRFDFTPLDLSYTILVTSTPPWIIKEGWEYCGEVPWSYTYVYRVAYKQGFVRQHDAILPFPSTNQASLLYHLFPSPPSKSRPCLSLSILASNSCCARSRSRSLLLSSSPSTNV